MSDPEIFGLPSPPEGRQRSSGKRDFAVFGAVGAGVTGLVVILVIVLSGGKRDGTAGAQDLSGTSGPAWSKASLGATITGTWVSGDDLVVATPGALTAYRVAGGGQDWTWPVPSSGTICMMSQSTSSPRGAVIYGDGQNCGSLQVLDLTTGEAIWSAPVGLTDSAGSSPASGAGLSIQGSQLVAPYGKNGVVDIDVSTGRPVWNTDQTSTGDDCPADRAVLVGAEAYYATTFCGSDGSPQIWSRDAAAAATASAMNLPDTSTDPDLLAAGNDLLVVCSGMGINADLYLATPGSSSFIKVNVAKPDSWKISADASPADGQFKLQDIPVHGDTLYIPNWSDKHQTDTVTAVDLKNGNILWTAPTGHPNEVQGLPGATSAGAVLGYLKNDGVYAISTMAGSAGAPSAETTFDIRTQEAASTYLLVGDYLIGIVDDPRRGRDPSPGTISWSLTA